MTKFTVRNYYSSMCVCVCVCVLCVLCVCVFVYVRMCSLTLTYFGGLFIVICAFLRVVSCSYSVKAYHDNCNALCSYGHSCYTPLLSEDQEHFLSSCIWRYNYFVIHFFWNKMLSEVNLCHEIAWIYQIRLLRSRLLPDMGWSSLPHLWRTEVWLPRRLWLHPGDAMHHTTRRLTHLPPVGRQRQTTALKRLVHTKEAVPWVWRQRILCWTSSSDPCGWRDNQAPSEEKWGLH